MVTDDNAASGRLGPARNRLDLSGHGTKYRRYAPAQALADAVEHYWSVHAAAPAAPIRAVLVPNGRCTLQFCLGAPGVRIEPSGSRTRNADVLLPTEPGPLVLEQSGPSHYVGVQFTPWGARRFWPGPRTGPAQIAELVAELPDRQRLAGAPAAELDRWLSGLPMPGAPAPELLRQAVRAIDAEPAELSVAELARRLGCATATLHRQFSRHLGVAPKRYLAVLRHRRFTDALLRDTGGAATALVAAAAGYYDQAHMNREFRRHTGMAPGEFRDTYDGIARLMALDLSDSSKNTAAGRR